MAMHSKYTHGLTSWVLAVFAVFALSGCESEPDTSCRVTIEMGDFVDEDQDLPELPSPITAEEITAIRTSFDWKTASPFLETNIEGQPALHYVTILVEDEESVDALRMMGIHFDAMPLFEEEWEPYEDKIGMVDLQTDGYAAAVFAFLPGAAFNILRDEALEGNVLFPAIVPREAPNPNALLEDGSLSYEVLVEGGFSHGQGVDVMLNPEMEVSVGVGIGLGFAGFDLGGDRLAKRKLGRIFRRGLIRRIVEKVVKIVKAVVQVVRVVASKLRQVFAGSREISLAIKVGNVVSEEFDSPTGEMVRAWGARAGQPLRLSNVAVHFNARFALERGTLNSNGYVKVKVPRQKKYGIAIPLNHKDVRIMSGAGIYEKRLVLYGVTDKAIFGRLVDDSRKEPIEVDIRGLRDRYANVFLQMQDGADYMRRVMKAEPMKVVVNVPRTDRAKDQSGPLQGRARAHCGSILAEFPAYSAAAVLGHAVSALWSEFDINMRASSGLSRETPTHEYGHWVMCQMLREYAYAQIPWVMERVLMESSLDGVDEADAVHLTEAWADFFASQVAGGTDYFGMLSDSRIQLTASLPGWATASTGWYCDDAGIAGSGIPCLEDNVGGSFYHAQVDLAGTPAELKAREVTILIDAVDGHSSSSFVNQPGNGTNWSFGGTGPRSTTVVRGQDDGDEAIVLEGADLRRFWKNWGDGRGYRFLFADIHLALATTMKNAGHTQDEICDLFALHTPSGDCADLVDLSEIFDGPPVSRPVGLSVTHLLPTIRGEKSGAVAWFSDPTESVDAYTLRLNINGSVYREITGVASLSNSEYVPDLPFDARIEFEARFSRGAELSGAVKRSIVTEAEPVPEIRDAGPLWGALLSWDATEASAYRVYVRDENGVVFSSDPIASTSFSVLAFIANDRPYTAWVVSLNQEGEECSFASDEHEGIATLVLGPG